MKPEQLQVVSGIVSGRDVFAVMPSSLLAISFQMGTTCFVALVFRLRLFADNTESPQVRQVPARSRSVVAITEDIRAIGSLIHCLWITPCN